MDIRRQRLVCIGIIVIAIWSVFGRTMWYGMIDLDDQEHLLANLAVSRPSWSGLLSIWREPYFKLYIPMTYTGWAGLSALASKLNHVVPISTVALYHMANVLCHTVSCGILFTIFRRRTHSTLASCLGALFFALHPLQVESIAWLSGFKDAFSGMLAITSIFFLLAYSESNRLALGLWSGTFYAAALLAKPTSVVTPLLGAVLISPEVFKTARTRLIAVLGLELFLGGLFVLYTRTIQPAADLPFKVLLWERPMLAADALLFYAAKVMAPLKLGFDYGMDPEWVKTHHPIFLALAVVVGAGLLLTFCSSWRRLRTPAALFVLGLLPTLGLVSYYYQAISTTADRYVYLAMVGPACLVAQSIAFTAGDRGFPSYLVPVGAW